MSSPEKARVVLVLALAELSVPNNSVKSSTSSLTDISALLKPPIFHEEFGLPNIWIKALSYSTPLISACEVVSVLLVHELKTNDTKAKPKIIFFIKMFQLYCF